MSASSARRTISATTGRRSRSPTTPGRSITTPNPRSRTAPSSRAITRASAAAASRSRASSGSRTTSSTRPPGTCRASNANPQPDQADVRAIDIWMSPHGFIKGAMAPGANPVLITRYENGAVGTLAGHRYRKLNIISFTFGKYRINGTINDENLLERIETRIANPVRGDLNYEVEYSQWKKSAASNSRATSTSTPTGTTRPSRRTTMADTIRSASTSRTSGRTIAARRLPSRRMCRTPSLRQ